MPDLVRPEDITDEHTDAGFLLDLLHTGKPAWMADAACQEAPLGVSWFPEHGEPAAPAKAVCAGCPVLVDCRAWSLAQGNQLAGIWGGLAERERRAVRAGRSAA